MVLLVPEVSKCSINNEQEILAIFNTTFKNNHTKHNLTQLSHVLQLSLETEKIFELFFKQIKQALKLTKLLYINDKHDISVLIGNKINSIYPNTKYIKKFELFYQTEYIGQINLASKVKFTPDKILELQSYVNLLILPLKNSLLYNQAIQASRTDQLTKLGNKQSLVQDLQYHFNLSKRYNSPLSVIFLDIDYFKQINDTYGHLVGDKILSEISLTLKKLVRKSDKIYRFGGEEFVILLEHTNQTGAENLSKKLKKFINKNNFIISTEHNIFNIRITFSMGITAKNNRDTPESIMTRADEALYIAKKNGRNQFVLK